ncbi:hypothetical protein [Rhodopseudomonas palustris]|nr:hypothetical protein [Rhodopseudomonas palustris]
MEHQSGAFKVKSHKGGVRCRAEFSQVPFRARKMGGLFNGAAKIMLIF